MINKLIRDSTFGFEIRGREVGELGYVIRRENDPFLWFHPYIFHINSPEGWNPSAFDRTPTIRKKIGDYPFRKRKFEFEFGFFLENEEINPCINQNLITN